MASQASIRGLLIDKGGRNSVLLDVLTNITNCMNTSTQRNTSTFLRFNTHEIYI